MRFILLYLVFASAAALKYPYNPRIHNMGNDGIGGRIHAFLAPGITRLIDHTVYKKDLRADIGKELGNETVLDIGCGVGISSMGKEGSLGIDTSHAMIARARNLFPGKKFEMSNGEDWKGEWDVVTIMYLFHEAPQEGRKSLIENAKKMARNRVIIVDISPDYKPSISMLSGEPYILDYLENVREDLCEFNEEIVLKGHVHKWTYKIE